MSSVAVPFSPENTVTVDMPTQIEGRAFDVGDFRDLNTLLYVRGASGTTPQLDVSIQHSANMRDWITKATFTPASAASDQSIDITGFFRYVRALIAVSGSPGTFTFYVHGIAKD